MDPQYFQQNNDEIAPGELRRTLIYIGKQLRNYREVLTAQQTEITKLVQACEALTRVAQEHAVILAAATKPAARTTEVN